MVDIIVSFLSVLVSKVPFKAVALVNALKSSVVRMLILKSLLTSVVIVSAVNATVTVILVLPFG